MNYYVEIREIGFEREKADFCRKTDYPSALLEALKIFDTPTNSQYKIIIKQMEPGTVKFGYIYNKDNGFNISNKFGYEEIKEIKTFDESIKYIYSQDNSTMPYVYDNAKVRYEEFNNKIRSKMTKKMLESEMFLDLGITELLNISCEAFESLSSYMNNNVDYIDVLEKIIHFYNLDDKELQKLLNYYFEKYK